MTIYTFSRQMGSLGDEIAAALAARIDAPLLDRARLLTEPQRYGLRLPEPAPLEFAERGPALLERLGGERGQYRLLLRTALYGFARRHDPAVIAGLGSHVFFAPVRHALRVLVVAPFERRVERVLAEFADREAAAKAVRQQDRERSGYHHYVHHVDWLSPDLYHLVVNTAETGVETAVELLAHAAELPDYRATPASRQALEDLELAARVEASLVTSEAVAIQVLSVQAERGLVVVSGMVPGEEDREAVESLVRAVPGVRDYVGELAVVMRGLPRTGY